MENYFKLLKILYGDSFSSILSVLNESIYVKEFLSDSFVFHTGFSFSVHSGEKMDILFCINTNTIIRSPKKRSNVPQLTGLLVKKEGGQYFNALKNIYVPVFSGSLQQYVIKDIEKYLSTKPSHVILLDEVTHEEICIKSFKIVDDNNGIHEFPLNKHLAKTVFYGQSLFQSYTPDFFKRKYPEEHHDHYSDYSEQDEFYDATDGQLDDLGDFGWTYLGRD